MVKAEKLCPDCALTLPLDNFYQRKNGKPGLSTYCKECHNRRSKEWKEANPERVRKANSTENRGRERVAEYNRRYREKNPETLAESKRKFARENPEKRRAHDSVRRAVKRGTLTRKETCERCKAQGCRIEASHDDYSKPLEVEWLCVPCHRKKDSNAKQG